MNNTGKHLSCLSVWIRITKSKRNMYCRSLKALSLHLPSWTFCSIPASKNVAHLFNILQLHNSPRIIPFSWDWYSAHFVWGELYFSQWKQETKHFHLYQWVFALENSISISSKHLNLVPEMFYYFHTLHTLPDFPSRI